MTRTWITGGLLVALASLSTSYGFAQQKTGKGNEQQQQRDEDERTKENENDAASSKSNGKDEEEHEVRVRYDDKTNRLYIDVDEAIRFRDASKANRSWARDGEFDLRYDTDRQDLKAAGEGTIDVDRAAGSVARWWQSWWEEEKTARRTRQQSSESGARLFIRQHDEDGDNRLSRQELPQQHRDEFARVDENSDDELSQTEIQRYGDSTYEAAQRLSRERSGTSRSQGNSDNQTWSQWWASWWSDEDQAGRPREQIVDLGAREFINRHDENDDGELVRSELPQRMYDDFERLDENGDRRLVRSEIERMARRSDPYQNGARTSRSEDGRR